MTMHQATVTKAAGVGVRAGGVQLRTCMGPGTPLSLSPSLRASCRLFIDTDVVAHYTHTHKHTPSCDCECLQLGFPGLRAVEITWR